VPSISPTILLDDYILEVDQLGNIVWEWHTYEHFEEFGFGTEAKQLIADKGRDWAHTNSIQSLPPNQLGDPRFKAGNILVSQRATNIVFIIDKDTGNVVWKIGPSDNLTIGQHDAKFLMASESGAGSIMIFDNGGQAGYPKQSRLYSRIVEVDPFTKQIVRGYTAYDSGLLRHTFFSSIVSNAQKLPNGNTFINEGENGRFFEVTPSGEIVWEYINPYFYVGRGLATNRVYRAWRVNMSW